MTDDDRVSDALDRWTNRAVTAEAKLQQIRSRLELMNGQLLDDLQRGDEPDEQSAGRATAALNRVAVELNSRYAAALVDIAALAAP